ncbi:RNA methyltransferase [Desulfococcus sp.]|uniref:RNA methyltransferase n=1 Tax=Desulfococcus sp. TaxID=2025834 RepID=UPI00359345EF
MTEAVTLDHITIVLHQPRYPENIGAAVRAMRNMGIGKLTVVDPREYDLEKIRKMATHACLETVEGIQLKATLKEALEPFQYVVGTTARLGGQRRTSAPAAMAEKLIAVSRENQVAVVFGREDRGLANDDLVLCHELVHIPTAEFSSLNLAQAVMVMCYELFNAGSESKPAFAPRMASRRELDDMLDQLKEILIKICYINPENPDYWMHHLRQFFTRIQARAREVNIIRGLIRQVAWHAEKRYRDGLDDGRGTPGEKETEGCG